MPATTFEVLSTGTPNDWTLGAGASKPAAVFYGGSHDDDSTYIVSVGLNTEQRFNIEDNITIPAGAPITSVDIIARCRSEVALDPSQYFVSTVVGGDVEAGATHNTTSSYQTVTDNFTLAPSGSPWTITDIDALVVEIQASDADIARCTTIYVVVNWVDEEPCQGDLLQLGVGI
jgi:hypothetical protein